MAIKTSSCRLFLSTFFFYYNFFTNQSIKQKIHNLAVLSLYLLLLNVNSEIFFTLQPPSTRRRWRADGGHTGNTRWTNGCCCSEQQHCFTSLPSLHWKHMITLNRPNQNSVWRQGTNTSPFPPDHNYWCVCDADRSWWWSVIVNSVSIIVILHGAMDGIDCTISLNIAVKSLQYKLNCMTLGLTVTSCWVGQICLPIYFIVSWFDYYYCVYIGWIYFRCTFCILFFFHSICCNLVLLFQLL